VLQERKGKSTVASMLAEALAEQQDGGPMELVQSLTNKVNRLRFSFVEAAK
jgi:Mrp family chromosome partitioning ATPase